MDTVPVRATRGLNLTVNGSRRPVPADTVVDVHPDVAGRLVAAGDASAVESAAKPARKKNDSSPAGGPSEETT